MLGLSGRSLDMLTSDGRRVFLGRVFTSLAHGGLDSKGALAFAHAVPPVQYDFLAGEQQVDLLEGQISSFRVEKPDQR